MPVPILSKLVSFLSQLDVIGCAFPVKFAVHLHWSASVIPFLKPENILALETAFEPSLAVVTEPSLGAVTIPTPKWIIKLQTELLGTVTPKSIVELFTVKLVAFTTPSIEINKF